MVRSQSQNHGKGRFYESTKNTTSQLSSLKLPDTRSISRDFEHIQGIGREHMKNSKPASHIPIDPTPVTVVQEHTATEQVSLPSMIPSIQTRSFVGRDNQADLHRSAPDTGMRPASVLATESPVTESVKSKPVTVIEESIQEVNAMHRPAANYVVMPSLTWGSNEPDGRHYVDSVLLPKGNTKVQLYKYSS